ncbi:MAG: hypothetical protein ACWIPH_04980 [Ostreibacterium sp.]
MKKGLISVIIIVILGIGGYIAMNQNGQNIVKQTVGGISNSVGDIAEKEINAFITKYKNKPLTLESLQSIPLIEQATWTITQSDDKNIKSQLTIKLWGKKTIKIPLNSQIIRGKTEYNGKTYGFGKILTKPDLSALTDLPPSINEDTISNTTYIALNGNITTLTTIEPVAIDNQSSFKGFNAIANTSLSNANSGDIAIDFKGLSLNHQQDETFNITPIKASFNFTKDGKYIGDSSAFTLTLNAEDSIKNSRAIVDFGKGSYNGMHKVVEGLATSIGHMTAVYDTITLSRDHQLEMSNVKLASGFIDAGNKKLNIDFSLNSDINSESTLITSLTKQAGAPIPAPTHVDFQYTLKDIGYDIVNTFYNASKTYNDKKTGPLLTKTQTDNIIRNLQKNQSGLHVAFNINTTQGDFKSVLDLSINKMGQEADPADFITVFQQLNPKTILTYLDGTANVSISETLIDANKRGPLSLIMGNFKQKESYYIMDIKIKDGEVMVNGKSIAL